MLAFALRIGEGCIALHNRLVRGLRSLVIQGDETWSFIAKKESRVDPEKDPAEYGDAYTFIALDAIAKLVISYHVGKRDSENADTFARDLRSRLVMVPHLSTDGFPAYPDVIAKHFQAIDFGTAVKHYTHGAHRGPDHRYEPPRDPFVTKHAVLGAPSDDLIGTPHVERYNLTQRHIVGRTRRLSLAFSKTIRGHKAAMALGIFAYNFVRAHGTLGTAVTPAMAAGLASAPWTIRDLVAAALDVEPCDIPKPVPLVMPSERAGKALGASRPLPSGGFLRAVTDAAPAAKGAPAPSPETPPAAPALAAVEPAEPAQLSLLDWKPRPEPKGQLSLFDLDPEPKK